MPPSLIIFDIDGTVFETQRVTVPAVQQTFAAYGLPVPDADAICSYFGRPVADYHAWLRGQCPAEKASEIIAATDALEIRLIAGEGRLFEGMRAALEALREEGHVLAVCSNAPEDYLGEVLDAHGLRPFFREVRCRGNARFGKAEMVADLMRRIDARPVVVVGDRHDDVTAAHANGALAIAAAYGFGSDAEWQDADARIHAPAELPGVLRKLLVPRATFEEGLYPSDRDT